MNNKLMYTEWSIIGILKNWNSIKRQYGIVDLKYKVNERRPSDV